MGTGKNACATKKKPLEVAARGKGLKTAVWDDVSTH
jgi:hypothetical protein